MTYDRYYYSILSSSDKQIYKTIYKGIQNFETSITVPKSSVSLQSIFHYIGLDNPHIFYVDFNHYTYSSGSLNTMINPNYWYTKQEVSEIDKKVQNVLKKMISRVRGKTDYEKEKSVHDLLIGNVIYDALALQNLNKYYPRSNSILGVLFYKTAVCEGIAKVTKMLLNLEGIKCIVVTGFAIKNNEPHAWNIVKINGVSYHLDVTWDISISSKNNIRYDYFNLTDEQIERDHCYNNIYPKCFSISDNYFYKNKLIARDFKDIQNLILAEISQGKRAVTFKFIGKSDSKFKNIMNNGIKFSSVFSNLAVIKYSLNDTQNICTIVF